MKTETIAAIATSLSESGISIIRVSGDAAITIVDQVFQSKSGKHLSDFRTHTIHYGHIIDQDEIVDEVMISIMKAPKSYTTEDTVEINCHGGVLITQKVLKIILHNGARLALPGEFTKRAFLNGRIDLSKAEAVMDVIHADNEFALQVGLKQLRGNLSEKVHEMREKLIYEIAFIESALDDPEHISLEGYPEQLEENVNLLIEDIHKMLENSQNGKILRQGIKTVIVGKPNAGKSSFLNFLIGEDKAIVTDIAGTTRDALEEYIRIGDISFHIIDTAGIRDTKDTVEKIGVEKAKNYAKDAELILFIVDSSVNLDENDIDIMKMTVGKKMIVLFNKSDLSAVISEKSMEQDMVKYGHRSEDMKFIKISAKEKEGIDFFNQIVKDMFLKGEIDLKDEAMITNIRQKEALEESLIGLELVKKSIENQMPEDFLTIDLMSSYEALGRIIGEEMGEDLVNEIFSKFCMGK